MNYRISRHAEEELIIRSISRSVLDQVLGVPDQIIECAGGRSVYQSKILMEGRTFLVRVVLAHDVEPNLVVTVYRTTKIEKYWREP